MEDNTLWMILMLGMLLLVLPGMLSPRSGQVVVVHDNHSHLPPLMMTIVIGVLAWVLFKGDGCKFQLSEGIDRTMAAPDEIGLKKIPDTERVQPAGATYEEIIRAIDYQRITPLLRPILSPAESETQVIAHICDLFDHVYQNWDYTDDPAGRDLIQPASRSWRVFSGDCEDYAVAQVAGQINIGQEVCIVVAETENGYHAYPEVAITEAMLPGLDAYLEQRYFAGGKARFYMHEHHGKLWLNLDYTASHPGGPYREEYSRVTIYVSEILAQPR